MKIERIHIENFGKLSNYTLDLKTGLNEIHEANGFGKTTLSIFIKVMFYGMPPSRDNLKMERKKYMPWQGGDFGGYIEFASSQGHFRLTRFFGKTPESDTFELLDLKNNKLIDRPKNEIGEDIWGVGKDTFEMTAFFAQNNFLSSANAQISASILGLDKLKFDLANVNLAIDNIKKKESEIKKLKPSKDDSLKKNNQILMLKNQLTQLQQSLEDSQETIDNLKKDLSKKMATFENIKKQHELQEELFLTKEKIEKELLSLSDELNKLYLEQEKVNDLRQNLINKTPKNSKMFKSLVLFFGSFLFLIPIVLSSLSIIKPIYALIISGIILIFTTVGFYLLNKKSSNINDFKLELEKLNKESDEIINKITLKRSSIENAHRSLQNYNDITNQDEVYFNAKEEISKINFQIERQRLVQENFTKEIDILIEDIETLKDEINNLELREKGISKKLFVLSKTREFLTQAHQNVSCRFVEPVNKDMSEILKKFDLDGRNFVVDTNFDIKQITDKGVKELSYSSQGIKDILSFCIRIYFINEIYKSEKPFIILDDSFVNLDDKNMKKASEILDSLANEYQIIYFYCHGRCKQQKS